MDYLQIINKLIGPIEPVGETNADVHRYNNLKEQCKLVELLLAQINNVARKKDSHEYSVKRVGDYADQFLSMTIGENQ